MLSSVWLLGLPGNWLLDDFSLLQFEFPTLLRPRPLSYLSFWLNFQLSGAEPWAFRLTNIVLHAVGVQFCYRALRRLLGERRALFAAAIFAVHPMQADAVLYIFGRPVVLMGLFVWIALDRWLVGRAWATVGCFALALAAKEEAIVFPLFLVALHFSMARESARWKPILAMFVLAFAAGAGVTLATAKVAGSGAGIQAGISALAYLATQPKVLGIYLQQVVFPNFLGFTIQPELWPESAAWLWLIPLAGLFAAGLARIRTGWPFWILSAWIFLLPTSSVFPLAELLAFRRMYLPLAFLAAAVPTVRTAWLTVAVIAFTTVTAHRSFSLYRDPAALWRATLASQPEELRPLLQYCKYISAAAALKELLKRPMLAQHAGYQTELGRVYLDLQRPAEALNAFGRALAIEPEKASNVYNRGVALAALGQNEAAIIDFKAALAIDPIHQPAHEALTKLGVAIPSKSAQ